MQLDTNPGPRGAFVYHSSRRGNLPTSTNTTNRLIMKNKEKPTYGNQLTRPGDQILRLHHVKSPTGSGSASSSVDWSWIAFTEIQSTRMAGDQLASTNNPALIVAYGAGNICRKRCQGERWVLR